MPAENKKFSTRKKIVAAGAAVLAMAGIGATIKGGGESPQAAAPAVSAPAETPAPAPSTEATPTAAPVTATPPSEHVPEVPETPDYEQMTQTVTAFADRLEQATETMYTNAGDTENILEETIDDGSIRREITFSAEGYNDQTYSFSDQEYPDGSSVLTLSILQTGMDGNPQNVYNITIDQVHNNSIDVIAGDGLRGYGTFDGSPVPDYYGAVPIDSLEDVQKVIEQAESYMELGQNRGIAAAQPLPV